jgi:hypothetical protein
MDDIATLTPAEATARLTEMGTAPPPIVPQNARDAKAQLDLLGRDPNWSRAFFSGNAAVRAQFDRLTALVANSDPVADTLAGVEQPQQIVETLTGGQLPARDVKAYVADMRVAGHSDGAIAQAMTGTPVTAAEVAATRSLQAARHSDPEWRARLLRGDYLTKLEHERLSIVLSSPIAEI